ncbi:hypothetical protein HWV07_07005 [Natronomonas salina]|uniref:SatD family protein n=1 Tax=Natronomonas salina TaxID=1710540 RepID=UPI0015B67F09|nr:SatD family protein [Natronomonas salina]QLD88795.1 hypothetical protein HWV07_07005 [Natronomonas salina]
MTDNGANSAFVALIGDIRGSRELDDRQDVQQEFKRVVDSLNEHLPDDVIASRFTVTTGDEFQGLLTDASAAVEAAVSVSDQFHPVRLRFGLGRGDLDTEVNPNQAIGMDGPCFHQARDAIHSARENGAWLRVGGWSNGLDGHVNSMFDLVQCVREGWTERQVQFAVALKEEGAQNRVAERFGVSKSTVSESLSAGHVQEVRTAERSLATLLQDRLAGADVP